MARRRKIVKLSKIRRKTIARNSLLNYLIGKQCADCGNKDQITFEFDHTKNNKTYSISKLVGNGADWDKILREIKKCDLVCANCHRRRTARRGQWYRYVPVARIE